MGMDGAELRVEERCALHVSVSAAEVDAARFDFHRVFPQRSAKRVVFFTQVLVLAALIGLMAWALRADPRLTLEALHLAALALFAIAILLRLIAAAHLSPLLSRLSAPQSW